MPGSEPILDTVWACICENNRTLEFDYSWKWRLHLLEWSLVCCERGDPVVRHFPLIRSD